MKNIFVLTDDELDALLLAQAKPNWQKVAMVIAKAMSTYETWDADRVGQRIVSLVDERNSMLEGMSAIGDGSEVRLPAADDNPR